MIQDFVVRPARGEGGLFEKGEGHREERHIAQYKKREVELALGKRGRIILGEGGRK